MLYKIPEAMELFPYFQNSVTQLVIHPEAKLSQDLSHTAQLQKIRKKKKYYIIK